MACTRSRWLTQRPYTFYFILLDRISVQLVRTYIPTNVTCPAIVRYLRCLVSRSLTLSLSLSLSCESCDMRLCCWGQVAQVTMSSNLQNTIRVSLEGLSAPRLRADTQVFVVKAVANRFSHCVRCLVFSLLLADVARVKLWL